jgi:2-aminoethylphosphonate-pyruvate transaminase
MKEMGFTQLLPKELQAPIIITFMQPKNANFKFKEFYNALSNKGFLIYPGKLTVAETFRVGCIGNLNSKDMYDALKAINDTIKELNIKLI